MVLVGEATAVQQERRRRSTGSRKGLFSASGNVWKTCTQRKDSWSRNGWCCLIGDDDDDRCLLHHDDTAHGGAGGRGRSRTSNGTPVAMEVAEEEEPP